MFSQFPGLANDSRPFPRVGRADSTGAFETKYLVANPSFALGDNRQRTRHYSLGFEGKSVAMKSRMLFPNVYVFVLMGIS